MEQNGTESGFRWTPARHKAALLVADDELNDADIAAACGIGRTTLHRWREHLDFAAQVAHHVEDLNRAMTRLDIAKKRKRVARLDVMEKKLWQIVEERASNYVARAIAEGNGDRAAALYRELFGEEQPAGGGTGLITRQIKQIGSGRATQIISEFGVATDIVKTIMSLHEQAAKELGQWSDNLNITGSMRREYVVMRDSDHAASLAMVDD